MARKNLSQMFVLRNGMLIFFHLSKSQLKKVFACEIAITNYYDISNYYDVDITLNLMGAYSSKLKIPV